MQTDKSYIPLYFADKLTIVNPTAHIGVITLWSKVEYITQILNDMGVDMDPETSKIAVIGNLYGNGIPLLLRNLLYNPQLRDIIICGVDRSGSKNEFISFFDHGLEAAMSLGDRVTRIKGTTRIIDDLVKPEMFDVKPKIYDVGELKTDVSRELFMQALEARCKRTKKSAERLNIPVPEVKVSHYPSEPRNCNIVKNSPLDAWKELVFRLVRFGHLVTLKKGDRQELQNVKVVIRNTKEDTEDELNEYGFSYDTIQMYQEDMFERDLPEDEPYTYGNRIRQYFGFDALQKVVKRLRASKQDRYCFISLWDTNVDIDAGESPCLTSVFFRVYDEKLTISALFRTHNALDAWLKNVYGLMALQRYVAEKINIPAGEVTVISHSMSIDPAKYDMAKRIAQSKGFSVEFDPNGQFRVCVVDKEIVVKHVTIDGQLLHEYRGKKAEAIQHQLNRDCAISDINHAIYIGRQIARAQISIERGEHFNENENACLTKTL